MHDTQMTRALLELVLKRVLNLLCIYQDARRQPRSSSCDYIWGTRPCHHLREWSMLDLRRDWTINKLPTRNEIFILTVLNHILYPRGLVEVLPIRLRLRHLGP